MPCKRYVEKKKHSFAICRTKTVSTLISQFSYWSNPGNGTWDLPLCSQARVLPLSRSSRGLTRIEPKFNSAAKAAWIGCMTLWMISRHFMKRSSCTKFNWFELFSRPRLDSTIHCINHHLVDNCQGNQ